MDKVATETKGNRDSIRITFNSFLTKQVKNAGGNPDEYTKSTSKKFNSKLDLATTQNKVKTEDQNNNESKKMPTAKNPKGKLEIDEETRPLPFGAVANATNSFLSAIFDDLEELTPDEKTDIGTCLDMLCGDYVRGHDKARKALGGVGILGIFGSKIKKAKKVKKLRKEKEAITATKELPKITKEDQKNFNEKVETFSKDNVKTDS